MQLSLKSVAAACALALVSVAAEAAAPVVPSQPPPITTLTFNTTSSDPLYVAVWDPISGKSLVQYLGLSYGQVGVADMTASLNFGTLSNFSATFGATTGLQFEVFSTANSAASDATKILTTSRNALIEGADDAADAQSIFSAAQSIGDWTNNRMLLAPVCNKANPCIGTDFNDTKSFAGTSYSDNFGGNLTGIAAGVHTSGAVGGPGLAFYLLNNVSDDPFDGSVTVTKYLGTWSLTTAGLLTYDVGGTSVPLPAAVWLLLSGLGGLGTIARRRRMAAGAPVAA